jgi:hypothetical protein
MAQFERCMEFLVRNLLFPPVLLYLLHALAE